MKLHSFAFAAIAALSIGAAQADSFTVAGTLSSTDPTFNRPLALTLLSTIGTATHYDTFSFNGVTAGAYNFLLTAAGFDPFAALYAGSFSAASPLTNLVAINDDFASGNLTQSGFTWTLAANTSYTFVTTAFDNAGLGTYTVSISPVPEPESWAMLALGVIAVGGALRRRAR